MSRGIGIGGVVGKHRPGYCASGTIWVKPYESFVIGQQINKYGDIGRPGWRYERRNRQATALYHLRRNLGISRERASALLKERENGRCAICNTNMDLSVDHSHETGQVRGILCRSCNSKFGWF